MLQRRVLQLDNYITLQQNFPSLKLRFLFSTKTDTLNPVKPTTNRSSKYGRMRNPFYSRGAFCVWDQVGQTMVCLSCYTSRSSFCIKTSTTRIFRGDELPPLSIRRLSRWTDNLSCTRLYTRKNKSSIAGRTKYCLPKFVLGPKCVSSIKTDINVNGAAAL